MEGNHSDNDRGVAPVVGVVLLVGITVILAAAVATFALGFVDSTEPDNPLEAEANFDFEAEGTNLTVTHAGGDSLQGSDLYVEGDVEDESVQWTEMGSVTEGDSVTVETTEDADNASVVVVYRALDDQILAEY